MQFAKKLEAFDKEIFGLLNESRRKLENSKEFQEKNLDIIDLSVGTPDFAPPKHVIDAMVEAGKDPENWKYSLHTDVDLINAVCSYYKRRYNCTITPDMVSMAYGTQQGMVCLALALLNPGDTVLVPDPCYPIFAGAVSIASATPVYYPLSAEHNFLPYVAGIPDDVADKAKYMVVSLPANPVGSVGTDQNYKEIIEFAKAHNVIIVHDNAYSDIVLDQNPTGTFLQYEGATDIGVEFYSLSKSFNVTGARISFLIGNPKIVEAYAKLRDQMDFGTFMPVQKAACAALTGPLDSVEAQRQIYIERRNAVCDAFEEIGWERPNAHGTMFIWVHLPERYRADSFGFVEELMQKTGVIVTPGIGFGPAGEGYIRMAIVQDKSILVDAIKRMGTM